MLMFMSWPPFHFVPHARGQKAYQLLPPDPNDTFPYFSLWFQVDGNGCDGTSRMMS